MSVAQLKNERKKLSEQLNILAGHQQAYLQQKKEFFVKISEASTYLSKKDETAKALSLIYNKSQEEGVRLYEELLTKLIHEIMPANDQCEKVILEQGMKRNRPTLNIKIQTADGMVRDVSDDKGGSIQNILAIGLRFIYVATTPGRNFIVFDEADTGLSELHMDDFSRMMDYLSRMTGIQVLYISHHPYKYFEGKGRIHNLKRVNGKIVSSIISDYDAEKANKEDINNEYVTDFSELYIRNIRLINCGQHEDTNLELSPFVNYIVGGNDIGKSTVIKLIKSVAFNKCNSSYIRDNTEGLTVQFGLEDDVTFEYSYKKNGAKKTAYIVRDKEGNVLNSSDSGDKAPLFINDYFSFQKFKNICPSISEQVSPIFVFDNDKFSEHERAEVLKLSDNASIAQKMIQRHHELVNKFTTQKRESEKEINIVKGKLASLQIMGSIEDHIDYLTGLIEAEEKREFIVSELPRLISSLEFSSKAVDEIQAVLKSIPDTHESVTYKDTSCGSLSQRIETLQAHVDAIESLKFETVPECDFKQSGNLMSLASSIEKLNHDVNLMKSVSDIEVPKMDGIRPTNELKKSVYNIEALESSVNIIKSVTEIPAFATPAIRPLNALKQSGISLVGLSKDIRSIGQELELCRQKEAELNLSFEEKLKHHATCPLCKQQIQH